MAEYFGAADLRPMNDMLRARTAEFGLSFAPPLVLSNSRSAILAAEYARSTGSHAEFSRRVFAAYFAEGRDIGDVATLRAVAADAGLDAEGLRLSLLAGEYVDLLLAAEAEARGLGITGVPTFFVGGVPSSSDASRAPSRRIVGAQPLEVFRTALRGM